MSQDLFGPVVPCFCCSELSCLAKFYVVLFAVVRQFPRRLFRQDTRHMFPCLVKHSNQDDSMASMAYA